MMTFFEPAAAASFLASPRSVVAWYFSPNSGDDSIE